MTPTCPFISLPKACKASFQGFGCPDHLKTTTPLGGLSGWVEKVCLEKGATAPPMNDEMEKWSEWARCCLAGKSLSRPILCVPSNGIQLCGLLSKLRWPSRCPAEEDEAPGARGKKLLKSASKVAELAALLKRLHDDLESAIESKTVRSPSPCGRPPPTTSPPPAAARAHINALLLSSPLYSLSTLRNCKTTYARQAEQRIAKTPATMKLFSRLLKLDAVLCSDAAEPLFSCMACLLPPLWVGEVNRPSELDPATSTALPVSSLLSPSPPPTMVRSRMHGGPHPTLSTT